jgi:DNA invertase Pin-like site-specific DNA recombinase
MHGYRRTARASPLRWRRCGSTGRARCSAKWRAKTDRAQLRRLLDQLGPGDVMMVTRLDRLARSTRDLLNTLAAITAKKAGFRSLGDAWADTTTAHGRLMLTVLGGLAEFERDLIRSRTGEGREPAARHDKRCDICAR